MPSRLVFLIRDLGPGGAQRQMVALATGMAGLRGWAVTVVHFYPGRFEDELRQAGIETICIGKRHRWDLAGFAFRLVRQMRLLRPAVIHGYLNEGNLMALLLKPLCGWPRIIWGVRDSQSDAHLWGTLGRLSFWLNKVLSRFADLIIANSKAGREFYLGRGYPKDKTKVVPNGIDVAVFTPGEELELRRQWAAEGQFVIGLIGRLNAMKGHETFLRAAALVSKEQPDVRFLIMGEGDATYASSLRALADSLGIGDKIIWSGARTDMSSVYRALDAVVSASSFGEGFSNVLGEAMACGCPCVATDVGDAAWLLDAPARVVPAGDVPALAKAMLAVKALAPADRDMNADKGRARICEHFTIERMVTTTAAEIEALARPKRVTFITTGLGTGGAEMMLWQILTQLNRRKFEPSVISLTAGGKYAEKLRAAGIQLDSLDLPPGKVSFKALGKLLRILWRTKPNILVGWMYHGCAAANVGRLLLPWPVRLLWCIRQSLYSLELEKSGSARVIRGLASLSWIPKAILYNSRLSADQHEAIGYRSDKRRLIANGFDLERWSPRESGEARPEVLSRVNGAKLVGRFGRYAPMKDYSAFLQSAALIAKEEPHVEFVLAGTGVDGDNQELQEEIRRFGLDGRMHLLGERDDLPAITGNLDLAVSSSAFGEGFPNVVGEAMACGVPVVATDVGDTAAVVGDAGRVVRARDPQALAEACLQILRLPEEQRRALGARGRQRIAERYSLAVAVKQLEEMMD